MKKNILVILVYLAVIALLNVLFFITMGVKNATNIWLSYGFTHLSFICMLVSYIVNIKVKMAKRLKIKVSTLGLLYFSATLVCAVIYCLLYKYYAKYLTYISIPLCVATFFFFLFCFIVFLLGDILLSIDSTK